MSTVPKPGEDLAMNEPEQGVAEAKGTLERFSVLVVGGGLTGLTAGYELRQRGIDFVILERGSRLGETWRPRWDAVRLFTPARFAGLPGFPFHGAEGSYLATDQISEYLERYAEQFDLPVRLGIDVLGLTLDERGQLLVEWQHGRLVADQVIVATDLQTARRTTRHDRDRRVIQLRVGEYRTLTQLLQAQEVVVVGACSTRLLRTTEPSTEEILLLEELVIGGADRRR